MSWVPNDTLRLSLLTELRDAIDAGTGDGYLRLFDGTRPATFDGGATTLLAELRFQKPCGIPSAEDVYGLFFDDMNDEASAPNSGTATWFRILDGDLATIVDGDVGVEGSGADLELADPEVVAGQPFTMGEWSLRDAFALLGSADTLNARKRTALTSARTAALSFLNRASKTRGNRPEDVDLIRRVRQAIEHGLNEKL